MARSKADALAARAAKVAEEEEKANRKAAQQAEEKAEAEKAFKAAGAARAARAARAAEAAKAAERTMIEAQPTTMVSDDEESTADVTRAEAHVARGDADGTPDVTKDGVAAGEEAKEEDDAKALLKKVKEAGVAGAISYAAWELGFWGLSVPVALGAYCGVAGHFPDLNNADDMQKLGAEAFAFVNLARFAVPLRIGLALGTTPWVQANVVDKIGFLSGKAAAAAAEEAKEERAKEGMEGEAKEEMVAQAEETVTNVDGEQEEKQTEDDVTVAEAVAAVKEAKAEEEEEEEAAVAMKEANEEAETAAAERAAEDEEAAATTTGLVTPTNPRASPSREAPEEPDASPSVEEVAVGE